MGIIQQRMTDTPKSWSMKTLAPENRTQVRCHGFGRGGDGVAVIERPRNPDVA